MCMGVVSCGGLGDWPVALCNGIVHCHINIGYFNIIVDKKYCCIAKSHFIDVINFIESHHSCSAKQCTESEDC